MMGRGGDRNRDADDFDVDALLEAPFKQGSGGSSSRENGERHSSKRDRDQRRRSRSGSRDRRRRRSRSRDHRRRSRSRSYDRRDDRHSRHHRRSRSPRRSPPHGRPDEFKRGGRPHTPSPDKNEPALSAEDRDMRTVLCMQLAARIRSRDLEEFFSAVGKVRDVRLITDSRTRRSKGVAYVEFADVDSVSLAVALAGQKLLGVPIMVQPSQAEKNRAAMQLSMLQRGLQVTGPMRLYVGNLHFNITEEMIRAIFEPFGRIDSIQLMTDAESGRSKGYAFLTFRDAEDAKKAMEQMDGYDLAGRPVRVNHVTERGDSNQMSMLDNEDMESRGVGLGPTGRLQLMAKLAEGTGLEMPAAAANALSMSGSNNPIYAAGGIPTLASNPVLVPPLATQCFMLSNVFNPSNLYYGNPMVAKRN